MFLWPLSTYLLGQTSGSDMQPIVTWFYTAMFSGETQEAAEEGFVADVLTFAKKAEPLLGMQAFGCPNFYLQSDRNPSVSFAYEFALQHAVRDEEWRSAACVLQRWRGGRGITMQVQACQ
jgi:hypothetical protein